MKYLKFCQGRRTVFYLLFWVIISSQNVIYATDYYLSSAGNDAATGTSQQASWKSISRLNQAWAGGIIKAGDHIYFRSGDTFIGQLEVKNGGVSGANVVISSYGLGAKPVISGAITLTGWSVYNGRVYQSASLQPISMVVRGNQFMTPARFPNSGWLTVDSNNSKTGFYDAALTQSSGYWNNAIVHARCRNWIYQSAKVSSFNNGTIAFSSAMSYEPRVGFGYYIDHIMSELDADNEWFYDAGKQLIYLQFPSSVTPSQQSVMGSIHSYGVVMDNKSNYLDINNISFKYQAVSGILIDGNVSNVSIKTCDFEFMGNKAIDAQGSVVIDGNTVRKVLGSGICIENGIGSQIVNNEIDGIGLIPGQGTDVLTTHHGIILSGYNGANCLVENNIVRHCGYNGIAVYGKTNKVIHNQIRNTLLTLSDGGAVYLAGEQTSNNLIVENVIDSIIGNSSGSASTFFGAAGVYLDDYSSGTQVIGNAVSNSSAVGLFISDSENNTLRNNKIYQCQVAGISVENPNDAYMPTHVVAKNEVVLSESAAIPLNIEPQVNQTFPAKCDSNYLANLTNPYAVAYSVSGQSVTNYDMTKWIAFSIRDLHSTEIHFTKSVLQLSEFQGDTLIRNYGFNSSVDGWAEGYPNNATLSYLPDSQLDKGAALFVLDAGTTQSGKLQSHDFTLQAGATYLLTFDVICDNWSEMLLNLVDQNQGSSDVSWKAVFPIPSSRRHYEYSIVAPRNSDRYRFEFRLRSAYQSFQLDNVFLRQMTAEPLVMSHFVELYTNPSPSNLQLTFSGASHYLLSTGQEVTKYTLAPWQSVFVTTSYYGSTSTGGTTHPDETFSLYPNPAKPQTCVFVQLADSLDDEVLLRIFDLSGKMVSQQQLTSQQSQIRFLAPGMTGIYVCEIESLRSKRKFKDKLVVY